MADVIRPAWMSDEMYEEWLGFYLDAGGDVVAGSSNRATEQFRASSNYERYFPGIKRDDGQIRYTRNPEQTYYTNIETFRNTVEGLGMNPDVFSGDYIDLIKGDTSPSEFASRASALEERVMSQGPAIRDWYAQNAGINMTREGILASLMSDRVDNAVLSRQITMAEIGGEGTGRGFDLSSEFVNLLAQEGMDRKDADRMFGSAERMLPTLSALAKRHGDPDDDFDITEFAQAVGLDDPEQLDRIERLGAQEESLFTGNARAGVARSRQTGSVTGLDVV